MDPEILERKSGTSSFGESVWSVSKIINGGGGWGLNPLLIEAWFNYTGLLIFLDKTGKFRALSGDRKKME